MVCLRCYSRKQILHLGPNIDADQRRVAFRCGCYGLMQIASTGSRYTRGPAGAEIGKRLGGGCHLYRAICSLIGGRRADGPIKELNRGYHIPVSAMVRYDNQAAVERKAA